MNEGRPKADRCNAPKARRLFPVVRGACHYRREGEARPLQRVEDKTTTLNIVAYSRQSRSSKNDETHEKTRKQRETSITSCIFDLVSKY